MNIQFKNGRIQTRRHLVRWAVTSALMAAIAWPGLIVDAPAYAANQIETVESWIDQILQRGGGKRGQAPEAAPKSSPLPTYPKAYLG
jgi:hypothetical protein